MSELEETGSNSSGLDRLTWFIILIICNPIVTCEELVYVTRFVGCGISYWPAMSSGLWQGFRNVMA